MAICSVSTKRVYWAALIPYWGGCTVVGLVCRHITTFGSPIAAGAP
jgi:hypothetical protein